MMRNSVVMLILTFIITLMSQTAGVSPPGKPRLTSCRSPEKETFTCWWEGGDDGGLPTTYALYYRLENSETVYECPDYKTAGHNSCFFNKNDTSLWVNYNITVVATNALGKNISDPVEVDVVYIVQPNTPENVSAVVVQGDQGPFLRVSWEKPKTADTRSGWNTLVYQLRVKQEKDKEWENFDAGMQKYYNVFSLHSSKEYMVQVRCKPDHGFWSEWTQTIYVRMPDSAGKLPVLQMPSLPLGVRPPGKPRLTSCRSPEKETFTCWWEGGDDGGLPTTYALYYRLENSETVNECPDYKTAGHNSCFFNKNDTSLWVNYNITVVATNALGKNISDPVEVDVVYIVQPNTPENVSAVVVQEDQGPFLRVSWEKPKTADTRSGWITLVYQLRVKQEKDKEWENFDAGMQKYYNVFSLHSSKEYMVQVRCKPDHGFWSEWTQTIYVRMPDYIPRERSLWIMITIFSVFGVIVLTWTLNVKRKSVKLCLLPPVPGPKIKGFDKQLLKNGKSEDVFNAFVIKGFPPTTDYVDLLVEYLEVYDNEEQELVLDGKDLSEGCLKSTSPSDSDSGRGSCDSRTLLLEKCTEGREGGGSDSQQYSQHGETSWASTESSKCQEPEPGSPESVNGHAKTWPVVFSSPQHHYQVVASKPAYHNVPEVLSISLPHMTPDSYHQQQDIATQEGHFSKPVCPHSQSYKQFSLDDTEHKAETLVPGVHPSHSMEYVEVQRVNPENVLLLRPLSDPNDERERSDPPGEDYSRVKEVTSENMILLQTEMPHQCLDDYSQVSDSQTVRCPIQPQLHPCKPPIHQSYTSTPQEGMRLMGNGYVDSTVMMPMY